MFVPIWVTPTAAGAVTNNGATNPLHQTLESAMQACIRVAADNPNKNQYTFYILDTEKKQIVKSAALPPPINLAWE